jgi:hypothetical protein
LGGIDTYMQLKAVEKADEEASFAEFYRRQSQRRLSPRWGRCESVVARLRH